MPRLLLLAGGAADEAGRAADAWSVEKGYADRLGLGDEEDGVQVLVRLLPVETEVSAAAGVGARLACLVNSDGAGLEDPVAA